MLLGLDYSHYESKEKIIDEKLLANRNSIAHGDHLLVDCAEYLGIHDEILALMQLFYDQIDNAARMKMYQL